MKIDHAQKLKIKKIETETETEILKIKGPIYTFSGGGKIRKRKPLATNHTSLHQKYTSTSHGHGLARVKHAISFWI